MMNPIAFMTGAEQDDQSSERFICLGLPTADSSAVGLEHSGCHPTALLVTVQKHGLMAYVESATCRAALAP